MTAGSWPEFPGRLGTTGLLYAIHRTCRPGWRRWRAEHRLAITLAALRYTALRCYLMLRARPAADDASPDGTACAPAARAVPLNTTRSGCEGDRHYFVKQGGQWVCTIPSCEVTR
jgi:hypothetical protein